jgi:cell division protein FtsZ
MIEFTRDPQNTIPSSSVKIVGLGGAGANMLDRVVLDGMDGAEMLAINTDVRTLAGSVAKDRIQLGRNLTKGLGAGGDPELGQQAILEAETEVRAALKGRKIVFLCVGLGGGTGSGAAPIVCRIAREEGAFVVVFATMPFAFEGRRRREQADTALNELAVLSNALVTFDNNRMGELVLAKQGIHEAFSAGDRMISESIKAVIRLVIRPGLIHVGLDELMTALRTTRSRCLFGSGISTGKDRAAKALRNALSSPLLDQGSLLKDAETVLVHLCGGEDLTLYEIELLMQSLSKHVPAKAHVLFGAAIDPAMGESLSITVVSALPEDRLHARRSTGLSERSALLDPSDGFAEEEPSPVPVSQPEPHFEPEPEPQPEPVKAVVVPEPAPEPEPEPEPVVAEKLPIPAVVPVPEKESPISKEIFSDEEPDLSAFGFSPVKPAAVSTPAAIEDFAAFAGPPEEKTPVVAVHKPLTPAPATESDIADDFAAIPSEPVRKDEWQPQPPPAKVAATSDFAPLEDFAELDSPLPPGSKKPKGAQSELSFDGGPRGRFEGASPTLFEGEDLDVPAFLRKKR